VPTNDLIFKKRMTFFYVLLFVCVITERSIASLLTVTKVHSLSFLGNIFDWSESWLRLYPRISLFV